MSIHYVRGTLQLIMLPTISSEGWYYCHYFTDVENKPNKYVNLQNFTEIKTDRSRFKTKYCDSKT